MSDRSDSTTSTATTASPNCCAGCLPPSSSSSRPIPPTSGWAALQPLVRPAHLRAILLALVVSTHIAALLALLTWGVPQRAWAPSLNASGHGSDRADTQEEQEYCEGYRREAFSLQPANSYSNLVYIVLGSVLAALGGADMADRYHFKVPWLGYTKADDDDDEDDDDDGDGGDDAVSWFPARQLPEWFLVLGLAEAWIGLGSYLFHSSFRFIPNLLDVAAIYTGFVAFFCYAVLRLVVHGVLRETAHRKANGATIRARRVEWAVWGLFVVFGLILPYPLYPVTDATVVFFTLLPLFILTAVAHFVLAQVLVCRQQPQYQQIGADDDDDDDAAGGVGNGGGPCPAPGAVVTRVRVSVFWTVFTAISFVVGFPARLMDSVLPCDPTSAWQWHALWHAGTAFAFFGWAMLVRSEVVEFRQVE